MSAIKTFLNDTKGATAIEYGLIAALIAIAAVTAMNGLGRELRNTFNTTTAAMHGKEIKERG